MGQSGIPFVVPTRHFSPVAGRHAQLSDSHDHPRFCDAYEHPVPLRVRVGDQHGVTDAEHDRNSHSESDNNAKPYEHCHWKCNWFTDWLAYADPHSEWQQQCHPDAVIVAVSYSGRVGLADTDRDAIPQSNAVEFFVWYVNHHKIADLYTKRGAVAEPDADSQLHW